MLLFEDLEANLTCFKVDIRVEDASYELNFWRSLRIILTDLKLQLEPALVKGRVRRPLHISHPFKQVVFTHWL